MTINEDTERLNPISFVIGSTFVDDILEGLHKFSVRVTQFMVLQVGDNPFVTVNIVDGTREFPQPIVH